MPTGVYTRTKESNIKRSQTMLRHLAEGLQIWNKGQTKEINTSLRRTAEKLTGRISSRRGQTKQTNESIRRQAEKLLNGSHWSLKYSEEEKQRIKSDCGKGLRGKEMPRQAMYKRYLTSLKNYTYPESFTFEDWLVMNHERPYPKEFSEELKEEIRKRDNYTCQLCGKEEDEELKGIGFKLSVNHIDFNKQNCSKENLNTLCHSCNIKINAKREYYTALFKKQLHERFI